MVQWSRSEYVFLREMLAQIDGVDDVYFVFWGNDLKTLPKELEIEAMGVDIFPYEEVVKTTDVLIEGTLTLEPKYEKEFRKYGAKIVTFRMGSDFIMDMEKFVNKRMAVAVLTGARLIKSG